MRLNGLVWVLAASTAMAACGNDGTGGGGAGGGTTSSGQGSTSSSQSSTSSDSSSSGTGSTSSDSSSTSTGTSSANGCQAITAVAGACDGKPPFLWLCATGGMPPDTGCVHPDAATEPNADIEYCCPNANCNAMGSNYDAFCSGATPHAWSCQPGATPPSGCVKASGQVVSNCCP